MEQPIKLGLAAKMLKTTRPKLAALLKQNGLLVDHRMPTEKALNDGLFRCQIRYFYKPTGRYPYNIYLITPTGFERAHALLKAAQENKQHAS